ncbi:hypothetical protein RIF29_18729 [Crotalaria pallida]|uniref:Uncharacterized protein n=1 Tax=Crotalaria pallida TaxID=3830 RepID=A0AAN9EZY3_CROPI
MGNLQFVKIRLVKIQLLERDSIEFNSIPFHSITLTVVSIRFITASSTSVQILEIDTLFNYLSTCSANKTSLVLVSCCFLCVTCDGASSIWYIILANKQMSIIGI